MFVTRMQLQSMWEEYVFDTYDSCSPTFWNFFNAVRGQSIVLQDKVLRVAKNEMSIRSPKIKKAWPASNRTLRNRIDKRAGQFWDHVLETHTIDLRQFGLPTCDSVEFVHIDPIWTWIQRCNELHEGNHRLIWEPIIATHPETGEEVFGSGIQCGLLLRYATAGRQLLRVIYIHAPHICARFTLLRTTSLSPYMYFYNTSTYLLT